VTSNTRTKITSWDAIVAQADPSRTEKDRNVVEYEFTSPGASRTGNQNTHQGTKRIFKGDYKTRGAYTPQEAGEDALLWNGVPLSWNGEEMDWGAD
jgi:hypothetical protein